MTDEGRRTVKMDAILSLIAGQGGEGVTDLLSFLTKRDLTAQEEPAVAAMCTGWIYSQMPSLMDKPYQETQIYDEWAGAQIKRLGENVSLPALPEEDLTKITSVLDTIADDKATVAEQAEAIAGLEGQVAELEPFKAQAEELEKKAADLEEKVAGLEGEVKELKATAAEFEGKLAVDENEINSTIQSIVSTALKNAVAAAPAGGAGGEAGEAVAEAAEAAEDAVPDTFGFGASGDDSDGFGF